MNITHVAYIKLIFLTNQLEVEHPQLIKLQSILAKILCDTSTLA